MQLRIHPLSMAMQHAAECSHTASNDVEQVAPATTPPPRRPACSLDVRTATVACSYALTSLPNTSELVAPATTHPFPPSVCPQRPDHPRLTTSSETLATLSHRSLSSRQISKSSFNY